MTDVIENKRIAGAIAGIAVAIACAVAFAPGAGARATKPSQVDVVGSGTIAWSRLAVLAKPKPGATRVAVLKQFRPDFRPQYVLALDAVRAKSGEPTWYRISVPGGQTGEPAGCEQARLSSIRSTSA